MKVLFETNAKDGNKRILRQLVDAFWFTLAITIHNSQKTDDPTTTQSDIQTFQMYKAIDRLMSSTNANLQVAAERDQPASSL